MERLAIDYVSPLPPVRSGIADYSLDLLPHLAEDADLRLARLPGQPVAAEVEERFTVVEPERLGEDGRLPLYQMGNNHYHTAVHELAMERPGVLTLHDVVLHHFLIEQTLKDGDFEAYRRGLEAEHGWIGDATARPRQWPGGWGDAAQFALPAHRRLLAAQRGVLVHSAWAADWLGEEMPGLHVAAVPMGVPPGTPPDAARGLELRRRYGVPEDAPLLGSFGFQTPIKRTDTVIRALARPELADAYLLVAGEAAATLDLEGMAARAGVGERVKLLGFLPFAELEAAIAASDLCLNLRYPTAGETSASLLRVLAVGKPAVVSDHAQMADLPDAGVVKVPLGDGEEETLARRLRELLDDPGALVRMGEAARRHVEREHAPERAAAAIAAACRRFADALPLGSLPAVEPPTSLAWDRLEGELEVEGAERPWPAGVRRRLAVRLVNRSAARWLAGERREGGVALGVELLGPDGRLEERPWLPLPFDLEPGGEHLFHLELRRPLGPARLKVAPHVVGVAGFSKLGGPGWEAEI